jgi:oligopeptidase A
MPAVTALPDLPPFDRLQPSASLAELDAVLARNEARLAELEALVHPRWETLVEPLEDMNEALSRVWGPISHLFGVRSTPEWREAYNAGLPKVTACGLRLSLSAPLYRHYQALAAAPDFAQQSPARQTAIRKALRDFELSGIGLPPEQQARFKAISLRLSELSSQFESQLMDAIEAFGLHVEDVSRLRGMPEAAQAAASAKAAAKGLSGAWLTLDFPSFDAVITHVDDRALRETLYTAYATRASDQGPLAGRHDNGPLMAEMLALRHEEAQLLGFANYAEVSLATKMAESPEAVERFLLDLARRARPRAEAELAELQAFARERDGLDRLQPWDLAYYSEKLRDRRLGLSDEALRPYFPLASVLRGLFDLVESLYELRITPVADVPRWHPDVSAYALATPDGERFGLFYLDPFAREQKRGGAWMDECQGRRQTAQTLQWPVAYLVCNFSPAAPGTPALLTHDEVLTLFHEFGHGLHHLLTRVDVPAVAGIHRVEWDAVELPSQFMENWCYHAPSLQRFACHWQTGEPLPQALIDQLQASRSWQSGLATLRQVEFALFDLRLHRDFDLARGAQLLETLAAVRGEVSLLQPPAYNRMPWSFGHIFAGGYAAGYYSYKWAEVLSADAFAAFEESGFAAETGRRFRDTVLAQGGAAPALEVFTAFRGRQPAIDALLRHQGLSEANPA